MTVVRGKPGKSASSAVAAVAVVARSGAAAGSWGASERPGRRGLRPGVWPLAAGGRGRTSQLSSLASVH